MFPPRRHLLLPFLLLFASFLAGAAPFPSFLLPTANRHLFEPGGGDKFYVGTAGKPWPSGAYGCMRSDGNQFHEGLDIRCLERDARRNPIDPILATAEGTVVYINRHPGLSNYGRYIVLQHEVEGLEIYSLYAHLSKTHTDLAVGRRVRAGEQIGVMGMTSNFRQRITKDRAHVHFELVLRLNPRYVSWHRATYQVNKVEHGEWNGLNLLGIDPARIFLAQDQQGPRFRLLQALKHETELCRVRIRKPDLQWARRFPALIVPNPTAQNEGTAGYELALNFNGIPFEIIPQTASAFTSKDTFQLVSVNADEYERNSCRDLVRRNGTGWELDQNGRQLLSLLAH